MEKFEHDGGVYDGDAAPPDGAASHEGGRAAWGAAPEVPGYVVGRELGRGGSASVWLVREERTLREFAVKCFDPPEILVTASARRR